MQNTNLKSFRVSRQRLVPVLVILAVSALLIAPLGPEARAQTKAPNNNLAQVDAQLAKSKLMQTLRKADPKLYNEYRQLILDEVNGKITRQEMREQARLKMQLFAHEQLKHASPEILKLFVTNRLSTLESVGKVDSETLYELIRAQKIDFEKLPEAKRTAISQIMIRSSGDMTPVITATPSPKRIPQDAALVKKLIPQINARLTPQERAALQNPEANHALFNQAYLHRFHTVVALPNNELVQVFRALNELPMDDRAK